MLKFELVTPDELVLAVDAASVTVPGLLGEVGVYPSHLPMLTPLRPGPVVIEGKDQTKHVYVVSAGLVEILPDRVTVLSDTVEAIENIDLDRAKRSLELTEKAINEYMDSNVDRVPSEDSEAIELNLKLQRARARIAAHQEFSGKS